MVKAIVERVVRVFIRPKPKPLSRAQIVAVLDYTRASLTKAKP